MDAELTLRDVMTPAYVGVSESDSLAGVAELLVEEGAQGAVVVRGDDLVGLVTARDVLAYLTDGGRLADASVADAMSAPPSTLSPTDGVEAATAALSNGDGRSVVVVAEAGEVRGLVDARDLVTAGAAAPPPNGEVDAGRAPVAGADDDRVGAADEGYSDQSVCEVCGSLASSLSRHNGQLVCANCLEM